MKRLIAMRLLLAAAVVALAGCQATISPFSPKAYEQATSLKVEALALMDKATRPYAEHQAEAEALRVSIEKAYEYAKGRPRNEVSVKQWEILRSPERNLLGGFLKRWETRGPQSPAFITETKGLVADAFDMIIGLESGKQKADSVPTN